MLGALSLKWKWRERREAAGKRPTGRTSCSAATCTSCGRSSAATSTSSRASSRSSSDKYTIGPEDVEPHVDENTIGVAAVLGTTFTGHADDIVGINDLLVEPEGRAGARRPAARRRAPAAASSGRSSTRTPSGTSASSRSARSTRRATSSASSTPASAGSSSGRRATSPRTSSSTRTTSARRDATFTLNFSTGSAMVLAQYYNFVRFGHDGYTLHHGDDAAERAQPWPSGSRRAASSS